jgi:hypothetical protein
MQVVRCTNCLRTLPMLAAVDCSSAGWSGRCERCGGPAEFARLDRSAGNDPVGMPTRLRLPRVVWFLAEKWYAWRACREMLGWYQRVRGEQPRLTGKSLYQQVIVSRSGLDDEAAREVLRRAHRRFCEWPFARKLRFRDVVHYVVIDEYLQSHITNLGTHTDIGKVVAHLIPHDL